MVSLKCSLLILMLRMISSTIIIAAMIVTGSLENGAATVTCSAQDVLDMRWIITGFPIAESVDFYTILRSGRNTVAIVEGITLSSMVSNEYDRPYSSVQSTMTVSSSLSQQDDVTFICSGHDYYYKSFFERAIISSNNFPSCKFRLH